MPVNQTRQRNWLQKSLQEGFLRKIIILFALFGFFYWVGFFATYIQKLHFPVGGFFMNSELIPCQSANINSFTYHVVSPKGEVQDAHLQRLNDANPQSSQTAQVFASAWQITDPKLGEADVEVAERIVQTLCSLSKKTKIASTQFQELGLNSPRLSIILHQQNDDKEKVWEFRMGNVDHNRNLAVAARSQNGEWQAYYQPLGIEGGIYHSVNDFQNLRVMKMPLDSIEFMLVKEGGVEKLTLERFGGNWMMKSNDKEKIFDRDEAEKYVNRIGTLRGLQIKIADREGKPCKSFFTPTISIDVEGFAGRKENISIQIPKNKNEKLLVCNSSRNSVFIVHRDLLQYLHL